MFRRIGWQVLLVGVGFLLTAAFLIYLATLYTTEFRPAQGGTYVESVGGYPQTLNPLLSFYNNADGDVTALTFCGLTRLGQQGEVEPDLATGWSIDPSGITYTFHLNGQAMWHDGSYVSADDVVFTFSLLQDPDYPGPPDLGQLWRSVQIHKLDDETVQFVLAEPYAPFLDYTTVGLLPAHLLHGIHAAELPTLEFNRHPIGCGPFRLSDVEITDGQISAATFKRFRHYYGPSAYLENVVLRFYATPRAALEAYQDGEVEGVSEITPELLPQAFAASGLNLYSAPTAEMTMLYLNELLTDTLPFDDAKVRQALLYSINRKQLINEELDGQAIIPETPLIPGTWAYTTEGITHYTFNQPRATHLLAGEGWTRTAPTETLHDAAGQPLAFTLMAANEPQDLALAQAIARNWAQVGISVTVQSVPPLALNAALESRSYQAALVHLLIPGDPDQYLFWHETQRLMGQNYTGFQHRRISEVLEQARTTINRDKRLALYREFQQLFMEQVPALPLYVPVYTYAVDARVHGVQIGPLMKPSDRFLTIANWYVLERRVIVSEQ